MNSVCSDLEGELYICYSSRSTALDNTTDRPTKNSGITLEMDLPWVVVLLAWAAWLPAVGACLLGLSLLLFGL